MSQEFVLETIGQPNYYNPSIRKFEVYFSVPQKVIEERECANGIVILIAGFGGHSQSNVYIKMRNLFADSYNLITVQCDYFGSIFMQHEVLQESIDEFCEMGPIQAMDNLIALKCVKDYLQDNNISYDDTNVIAYGHSQGAYLGYLMNALMPSVLSCIIDNSAWLYPSFIDGTRFVSIVSEDGETKTSYFKYITSEIIFDRDIYKLEKMYSLFENKTSVLSFHGVGDNLIAINDKLNFIMGIKNSSVEIIGPQRTDDVFKSYRHGLDADFIKMFAYVLNRYKTNVNYQVLNFDDRHFETEYAVYYIDNSDGIPVLYCNSKV